MAILLLISILPIFIHLLDGRKEKNEKKGVIHVLGFFIVSGILGAGLYFFGFLFVMLISIWVLLLVLFKSK